MIPWLNSPHSAWHTPGGGAASSMYHQASGLWPFQAVVLCRISEHAEGMT